MPDAPDRPDLDALLREWQPIMRLADWSITVKYERHITSQGWCRASWAYKEATIRICDPIDYQRDDKPQDVEHALVHELGHCHMSVFRTDNGTPLGDAEEQVVESYARALIAVKRGRAPSAG